MGKRSKCVLITACVIVMLSGCQKMQTVPLEGRSEFLSEETAWAENSETNPEESGETAWSTSKEPVVLSFHDMYSSTSSSRGLQFSEAFVSMDGKTVQLSGYMAPPLKPVFQFFVLSRQPMSICPFCSSDADWPEDIVVVYVEEGTKSVANDTLLTITGRLVLGSYTDEETGFISQARIYADEIQHNH